MTELLFAANHAGPRAQQSGGCLISLSPLDSPASVLSFMNWLSQSQGCAELDLDRFYQGEIALAY